MLFDCDCSCNRSSSSTGDVGTGILREDRMMRLDLLGLDGIREGVDLLARKGSVAGTV